MRYLVKARVKSGKDRALVHAVDQGTLGRGSIAGDEYLHNMREARVNNSGIASWVETCFCDQPLAEERPYWEAYFELLSVKDAHSRRNCRHENGTEPWACCDCDCTKKLEQKLRTQGMSFLNTLRSPNDFRSPLQLRLRRAIRRNSSFVIRASPLVGFYSLRASESKSRSTSKRSKSKRIYAS